MRKNTFGTLQFEREKDPRKKILKKPSLSVFITIILPKFSVYRLMFDDYVFLKYNFRPFNHGVVCQVTYQKPKIDQLKRHGCMHQKLQENQPGD